MDLFSRLKAHDYRARALWAAFFALVAATLAFTRPPPPPRTPEGVAAMLAEAVSAEVHADDFVWEERGGFLRDAFLGRRVLFLARRGAGAPGDLYRARVRLTRTGRPVRVSDVHNLTASPLGDDRELVARGRHAALVTTAAGAVQGITLLDLDGEGAAREARTWRERFGASIAAWVATGSAAGIGRTEVTFEAPPESAKVELSGDALVMALGKEGIPAALDLSSGALNAGPRDPFAARALRIPRRARALGPTLVSLLTEVAGEASGRALAAVIGVFSRASAASGPLAVFPGREPPAPVEPVDDWPPPAIAPVVAPPLAGEGLWAPGGGGAPILPGAPPALYETAIRPRRDQPDTLVRLVALDLRQLDLRLEAGFEQPPSTTGIHGAARLPDGPLAERVVAAFTAGPASTAASLPAAAPGVWVNGRALSPLVPNAAAVVLGGNDSVVFGPWTGGSEAAPPITAVLQTPDPLVGGDPAAVLPLDGATDRRPRSALCALPSGHAVYAESVHADAASLAAALRLVGCVLGVHLAATPAPAGFAYLHAGPASAGPRLWEAAALAPGMSLDPARLASGSPNAFFYAVSRDFRPHAAPAAGDGAPLTWAVDGGSQPTPAWIPSMHGAVVSNLGANVHLTIVAPGRVRFRLRAGTKEPATKSAAALAGALPEAEQARALAAVSLGAGRRRGARGLAIEGAPGYPFRGDVAAVLLIDKGRPQIVDSAGFILPAGADATELPLTADEGQLRPEARDVGSMRSRGAACVLADGTFAVASTTFDSDEAATSALLELGCKRVVALDRGSHAAFFLNRAGTEPPLAARYETTVLDLIDTPMTGRAKRAKD